MSFNPMNAKRYYDYLEEIADTVTNPRENRAHKKSLPKRVHTITGRLREIEKLCLPPDTPRENREMWEDDIIIRQINFLWKSRNELSLLEDKVGRILGRAMGNEGKHHNSHTHILPDLEAVVDLVEIVQKEVPSVSQEPLPLTALGRSIRDRLEHNSRDIEFCREILREILTKMDTTNSETSTFGDLRGIIEVGMRLLDGNSHGPTLDRKALKDILLTVDPKWAKDIEAIEADERMQYTLDQEKRLGETAYKLMDTERKLTAALREADQLRNNVRILQGKLKEAESRYQTVTTAKQAEIQKLQASEKNLRAHHQQTLEVELEKAKRRYQTTEQGLKESHAKDLKHAESTKKKTIAELEDTHSERIRSLTSQHAQELESQMGAARQQHEGEIIAERKKHASDVESMKEKAIVELEDAHSEEIKKLTVQHAKQLDNQKTAIARQHDGEMIAERKKHTSEKLRIETHLRGLHDDALRKQKEAENSQAASTKELHERMIELSEAQRHIIVQSAQLRKRASSLSEARKQINERDTQLHEQDVKLREQQLSLFEARKQIKTQDDQRIALEKRHSEELANLKLLLSTP